MRLLVVSQYFWPENFRINDLVAEMVRRGHEVTVLTGKPNYPAGQVFPDYQSKPEAFSVYEGARIVRVPMLARGRGAVRLFLNYLSYALSASTFGLWKLRGTKFDAILVYQLSPVTVGIPGVLMRAVKRAPMTMWILDLWPDTLQAIGVVRSEWLLRQVGRLVAWIYKRCDLILVQSRSFISQVRLRSGAGRRVEYFPSWAEAVFDGGAEAPVPEIEPRQDKFTVMFAGNMGEAQDFPAILAAAEKLKNAKHIRWLLVGDGRMTPWVVKEIEARGLSSCVQLLGRHPVERMPDFFRHADALLLSLKDEPIFAMTIPGKLQSYLAAGKPVLAMLNGEGADLLLRSKAGLACPAGDYEGLAKAVLQLSVMPVVEREHMGEQGRALYRREFDRTTSMDKLESWLINSSEHKA